MYALKEIVFHCDELVKKFDLFHEALHNHIDFSINSKDDEQSEFQKLNHKTFTCDNESDWKATDKHSSPSKTNSDAIMGNSPSFHSKKRDHSNLEQRYATLKNSFTDYINSISKHCRLCLSDEPSFISEVSLAFETYRNTVLQYYTVFDFNTTRGEENEVCFLFYEHFGFIFKSFYHNNLDVASHVLYFLSVLAYIDILGNVGGSTFINSAVKWNLETALHQACSNRNFRTVDEQLVRLLLDSGARVTVKTVDGFTPLHSLCRSKQGSVTEKVKITRILMENNCDINAQDVCGRTCLHIQTECYGEAVELYINLYQHIDLSIEDNLYRTSLYYADNLYYLIKVLHEIGSSDRSLLAKKDIFGLTALHWAIYKCCVNRMHVRYRNTPAQVDRTIIPLLHRSGGAGVNISTKMRVTPLHLAMLIAERKDILQVVSLLLENNADPNATDTFSAAPVHYAVYARCEPAVFHKLIEFGADMSIKDDLDRTAFNYALELGFDELFCEVRISDVNEMPPENHKLANGNMNAPINSTFVQEMKFSKGATKGSLKEQIRLKMEVDKLVRTLLERVERMDHRFKGDVCLSGSVQEGTKCEPPDEFDYVVNVPYFEDLCRAVCHKTGQAKVTLISTGGLTKEDLFDDAGTLSCNNIKEMFFSLVERAAYHSDIWNETSLALSPQHISISGPSVCLKLVWYGLEYKALQISIDLVLTIPLKLENVDLSLLPAHTVTCIRQFGPRLVLPQNAQARLSMSHVEVWIMNNISKSLREGYKRAKAVRGEIIEQSYSYLWRQSSHEASALVRTYALKNCFLHYIYTHGILAITGDQIEICSKQAIDEADVKILSRRLYEILMESQKESFFFPHRIVHASSTTIKTIFEKLTAGDEISSTTFG